MTDRFLSFQISTPKSCFSSSERRPNLASSIFIDLLQKLLNVSPLALHALQIRLRSEFSILRVTLFVIGMIIGTFLRQLYMLNCTTLFVPKIGISLTKPYYPYKDYNNSSKILSYLSENRNLSTHEIAEKLGRGYSYSQKRVIIMLNRLKELQYCKEYRIVSNSLHECDFCKSSKRYLVIPGLLENPDKTLEKNKKPRDVVHILGRRIWLECFYCNKHVESHPGQQYKVQQDRYWKLSYNGELVILGILKGKKQYDFIKNHTHNKIIKLVDILLGSGKKEYVEMLINNLKRTIEITPNLERTVDDWYIDVNKIISEMKLDNEKRSQFTTYKDKFYIHS